MFPNVFESHASQCTILSLEAMAVRTTKGSQTILGCKERLGKSPLPPSCWDSFDGGEADGGERFLSAFCMMVRCRWPSGERHRTVMQMLRSFGLPCARQGMSHLFGGTVFVCPVLRGIRPSQIPGSPPPRSPPTKESQSWPKPKPYGASLRFQFPFFCRLKKCFVGISTPKKDI